jgi:beta-glucanase (GH16 family)
VSAQPKLIYANSNGEFDQTTEFPSENLEFEGGSLRIKATIRPDEMPRGFVKNNNTEDTGIQVPVYSGRINTKNKAQIKYGRVEVVAKMPKGDWLWPAIWMMPANDNYGPWPASGEIDIAEGRGNNHTYSRGGVNVMSSALHWGPEKDTDMWWQTYKQRTARHNLYSDGFNTFGLEWSEKYLFTYLNNRLMMVMYTPFSGSMWKRGKFPPANSNGSALADPWSHTGRDNTPFDQEFYLILNLAVGGTNGWFDDGKHGKPWTDRSRNASEEFWNARDTWYPTWTQPYMEIKKVTMLQQCDGGKETI